MRVLYLVFFYLLITGCDNDDQKECQEKTKESCVVTFELNPVCGCNGVTYDNPSLAECNSISDYTMGPCE